MRNPVVDEDLHAIAGENLPWEQFAGKTVLITGANGFLPAYMVETLLVLNESSPDQRTQIIALVRNRDRAMERFAHYQGRADLVLLVQDVCVSLDIHHHVDFIIHAASQASPKYYRGDPVGTLAPNVIGTYNLLEMAREHRVKGFLFFSSGEVYGQPNEAQSYFAESDYGYVDPMELRSCYAESKRMGETMCVAWAAQHGVPTRIVRPFHTYGPGMRLDDGRVFADFVADIVNNRDIVMKSDGQAIRAFCYLADATAGFFTVLLRGGNAEAYNIGNADAAISVLNLANILIGLFPEKNLRVVTSTADRDPGYMPSPLSRNCPDTSKARQIGWEAHTGIAEGFHRTIRSYI